MKPQIKFQMKNNRLKILLKIKKIMKLIILYKRMKSRTKIKKVKLIINSKIMINLCMIVFKKNKIEKFNKSCNSNN